MPRNPKIEFDELRMYFGEPYVIDVEDAEGIVTVYSPTIGDIISMGENKFYQGLNIFICNTTSYRMILWDMGIDWNTFPDFHLFIMLYNQIDPDVGQLLFKMDFSKFVPFKKPKISEDEVDENNDEQFEIVLYNHEDGIEINETVYFHFSQYLREIFGIEPEEKITADNTLKSWYITKDRRAAENSKKLEEKGKEKKSHSMKAIVSSFINHPGTKYKLSELKEVGVAEFYDSVRRLQVYEQSTALMKGMYSGFVDSSKIKSEDYNFMRDI